MKHSTYPVTLVVAFALLGLATGARADVARFAPRVTLTGSLKSTMDFTKRTTFRVPAGISTLSVNVPVPRTYVQFGFAQSIGSFMVDSTPRPTRRTSRSDAVGNLTEVLSYDSPPPGEIVIVETVSNVETDTDLSRPLPETPFPIAALPTSIVPYTRSSSVAQSSDSGIIEYAAVITHGCQTEAEATEKISEWVVANITYRDGIVYGDGDALSTLCNRSGQCRGFANAFVAIARAAGIPARVARGTSMVGHMMVPVSPDGRNRLTVSMLSGAHAWVEVWFRGAGWVPIEPQTSMAFIDTHRVRFAVIGPGDDEPPYVQWSWYGHKHTNVDSQESVEIYNMSDHVDVRCISPSDEVVKGKPLLERSFAENVQTSIGLADRRQPY